MKESECIHEMSPLWCATCLGQSPRTNRPAEIRPERVILEVNDPPDGSRYDWNPIYADVTSVPKDVGWIHICGWTSQQSIEDLLDHCPNLRLIEVPPSIEGLFDQDLIDILASRHIGLHLARIKFRRAS